MSRLITEMLKEEMEKVLAVNFPGIVEEREITVEPTKEKNHGDFATNLAFILSRKVRKPPRELAINLQSFLSRSLEKFARVEVAGGGFINFFLEDEILLSFIQEVEKEEEDFGTVDLGKGKKTQVEFVSVNPTGPLHVGHGKCAAFGDSLSRILKKAGFQVEKEYYINDAGRQIDLLGASLEARFRQLLGEKVEVPEDGYQGEYLIPIAEELLQEKGREILNLSPSERLEVFRTFAVQKILNSIRHDLDDFRVHFDVWFRESSLYQRKEAEEILSLLKERGYTYNKDGALWLRTTDWGDDKDRVLVRENGLPTYFASDIAYHWNKWERGFQLVIDIWGADHHGYIPRMYAAMRALGLPEDFLEIFIVQFVTLLRRGQPERMSTRQGEFVPLRQLIDEVGVDVARYYFLMRDPATHLEFDIEEAKKQSMDNPVYYVQYAHARIASLFKEAEKRGFVSFPLADTLSRFPSEEEREIVKKIAYFPETVKRSALLRQPYLICNYLQDLCGDFHSFYNLYRIIDEDNVELTYFRLNLCRAVQIVLKNAFQLLGISAPDTM
ncbi:MAG TPA: arginine--tRNA ligase [Candidatus Atribacteria bacterium]|nr:arginine--tRNA ligase [Candidatus Atribacteria bacterium]